MNIIVTIILTIAVAAGLSFIFSKVKPSSPTKCKVVKAGDVSNLTKISTLTASINSLDNKTFMIDGKQVDINNYEIFVVDGESMRQRNIHTGNGLLVRPLSIGEKANLSAKDLLVLEIDIPLSCKLHDLQDAHMSVPMFKLREFIGYVRNNSDLKTLLSNNNVAEDSELFKQTCEKYTIVKAYYPGDDILLLSDTYADSGRSFSIHSPGKLLGKVDYIIPANVIKL